MLKVSLTAASAAVLAVVLSGPVRADDFVDLSADESEYLSSYYQSHPVRGRVVVEDDDDDDDDVADTGDDDDEVVRVGTRLPDKYEVRPLPSELHGRIRAHDRYGAYTDDDDNYIVETTTRRVVKRVR